MKSDNPAAGVRNAQRAWAARSGLTPDEKDYLPDVASNLRAPLSAAAEQAFRDGDGAEFDDQDGRAAKMRSLISSSALAANVFDHWSGRDDLSPLLAALGAEGRATDIRFEEKLPTGARGNPPNLDVVLSLEDGRLVGIESKFTEWMTPKGDLAAKLTPYLGKDASYWSRAGLPASDRLAREMTDGRSTFAYLDVPQLLKHALGLARKSAPGWLLRYVYFDAPGLVAGEAHAREIAQFEAAVGDELSFRAVSYQRLLAAVATPAAADDEAYHRYLADRYLDA